MWNRSRIAAIWDYHKDGFDFVSIPKSTDLNKEYTKYEKWYWEVFIPNSATVKYLSFTEYLMEYGKAKKPKETELEIWEVG